MFSSNSDGVLQVKLFLNLYRQLKYSVFKVKYFSLFFLQRNKNIAMFLDKYCFRILFITHNFYGGVKNEAFSY